MMREETLFWFFGDHIHQGSLLALHSEITDGAQETSWDAQDQIQIRSMQGKCLPHYTITLVPENTILFRVKRDPQ